MNASMACSQCGARYPANGRFDMLPEELRDQYRAHPPEKTSEHPYDQRALDLIDTGGMVLDCGSGRRDTVFANLVQLEIAPYENVDVLGVNQMLPFADESFDAVLSLDVLEHVDDPFRAASEIRRVLKPGGVLYVDIPFMQHEHGYPDHYFNVTRRGLRRLFRDGMTVEEHWVPNSGHPLYTLFFVSHSYYGGLPRKLRKRFERLTFGDLIHSHPKDWYGDALFTDFDPDRKWVMASTTRALIRKNAEGETSIATATETAPVDRRPRR
jgi:SAM-dependent methyltransferase